MQRFLIIRSGNIGDTIWATTFLDALHSIFGADIEVDLVAKGFACSLLKHDPRVNKIHVLNHRRLALRWSRAKRSIVAYAKRKPYDVLINAETASFFYDLVRAIPAKYKIGPPYRMPPPGDLCPVDGYNFLLQQLPFAVRPDFASQRYVPKLFPVFMIPARLQVPERYIVVTPATSNSAKGRADNRIWPLAAWRRLIEILAVRHRVVILGSRQDVAYIQGLGALPSSVLNLVGKTSLDESLALIQRAQVLVAADTGTTHMAAALGVPLAAIYGPSNPRITGPYLSRAHTQANGPCGAMLFSCYLDNGFGPYLPDTPPDAAMQTITPEMVGQAVIARLSVPVVAVEDS